MLPPVFLRVPASPLPCQALARFLAKRIPRIPFAAYAAACPWPGAIAFASLSPPARGASQPCFPTPRGVMTLRLLPRSRPERSQLCLRWANTGELRAGCGKPSGAGAAG